MWRSAQSYPVASCRSVGEAAFFWLLFFAAAKKSDSGAAAHETLLHQRTKRLAIGFTSGNGKAHGNLRPRA